MAPGFLILALAAAVVCPEGEAAGEPCVDTALPRDPQTRPPPNRGFANLAVQASVGGLQGSVAFGGLLGLEVSPLRVKRGSLGFQVGVWGVVCEFGCGLVGLPLAIKGGPKFGLFEPTLRAGVMPALLFRRSSFESVPNLVAYLFAGVGLMIEVGRGGVVIGFDGFFSPGGVDGHAHAFVGFLF